jgi:glycosyltransferase involved in cell wall biosynthesis
MRMLVLEGPRRWLCKLATVNLCITNHVANRVRLPRSTVIYHGVPDSSAGPEVRKVFAARGVTSAALTVGFIGRLVQEKDVPILIQAVQQLQLEGCEIALKIIGDGPERKRLEQLATNNRALPHVEFAGTLRGEALSRAVEQLDVLVLPTRSEETAGLVVMEQMMRGRPSIVTDNGGSAEVAGDGGLTFPPGDVTALTECLRRFLNQPELLLNLGEIARRRAIQSFSLQGMVENHYNLFKLIMRRTDKPNLEPLKMA